VGPGYIPCGNMTERNGSLPTGNSTKIGVVKLVKEIEHDGAIATR
jgi:hypothetical protein